MTDLDVEQLIGEYRAAFNSLDPDRVAALYDVATAIVDEAGTWVFSGRDEIRQNMVALTLRYRERGFTHADTDHVVIDHLSASLSSVDVGWTLHVDGAADVFATRYWLADREGGPKVAAVLAYSERV